MLNPCLTHCLGWDPNQANCWVPSPAPHWTPLWGQQDPRHRRTSATLRPQFHHLTWPFLGCQLRCHPSWWVRMRCSAWHRDRPLRAQRHQELVLGRDFSGRSSCSDSPMSLGSPAITSSLTLAWKTHAHVPMPALLDNAKTDSSSEDSSSSDEEDMDAVDNSPREETD